MDTEGSSAEQRYKLFQDRFRGAEADIRERMSVYVPLLGRIPPRLKNDGLAIDLACGRGEWLGILDENGFAAIGIDTNASMLEAVAKRGLRASRSDALEFLAAQANGSASVISSFHFVEHVAPDYLEALLAQCHRVLGEGGLLIVETPNPENLTVGSHTFHLDPTHLRPIPPELLDFLCRQAGFAETAVIRLNGPEPAKDAGPLERAGHLLLQSGLDCACIARKSTPDGSEEDGGIMAFAEAVSQVSPANIEKVQGWLRSADDRLSCVAELEKRIDELRRLVENRKLANRVRRSWRATKRALAFLLGKIRGRV